jgi:hypothetical protein
MVTSLLRYATERYTQLHLKQVNVPVISPKFGLWSCHRQNMKPVTVTFLLVFAKFAKKQIFYSDATRCAFPVS